VRECQHPDFALEELHANHYRCRKCKKGVNRVIGDQAHLRKGQTKMKRGKK